MGDQVKGRSPKKLKSLIEVPNVVHEKVDRVIRFGETLGDQIKGRPLKKLESLIAVPNVVHVKVHVLSFNMIFISSQ